MQRFKKIFYFSLVAISTFILVGCGQTAQSLAERDVLTRIEEEESPIITWGVKADTNLFGFYNIEEQEIQGFDVDIAKAVTDEITNGKGQVNLVEVTSGTRIPLLKNGNIDAIIATMTISEERMKVVDFSDVYFDAGQALLVHKDSDIEGIDSLTTSHTVVAVKGSTSAQNIAELAPEASIIELDNYSEGFLAVQSGQADALTTDNAILLGMVDTNQNYKLVGENFTEEPYGIAINKGQEPFLDAVNDALQTLKENGTYDELYDKWFGHVIE